MALARDCVMAEITKQGKGATLSAKDVCEMTEDRLLSVCQERGITLDQDEDPDVGSYRTALLNYIAETQVPKSSVQELPLARAAARFKERHSQLKSEILSEIEMVEAFVTGGDVKPLLSNLVIPSRMHWISDEENSGIESSTQWIIEEMFKRIRKEISEAAPVLLVAG